MSLSERDAKALDAALVAAPFVVDGWKKALAHLAQAGGAWAGQLMGLNPTEGLVFRVEHGFTPEDMAFLERAGGYLDEINPRIGAMMGSAPHQILSEPDFIGARERSRSALYQEWLVPYDSDLSCIGRLQPLGTTQVAWCILKPGRSGDYSDVERAALASAMPSFQAAIRLHLAVEQRGAELIGRAFDALKAPAFLFDRQGRVIAVSHTAARMVRDQEFLRLKQGVLSTTDAACNASLQRAIHECCQTRAMLAATKPVLLRSLDGMVIADVSPVPPDGFSLGAGPVAILIVRSTPTRPAIVTTLKAAFGMTGAEADVAASLAQGMDVQSIATERHASIQTVRSQVKTILSKTGARNQVHLVSIIGNLSLSAGA